LLDRSVSPEDAGQRAVELARRTADLRPGTVLGREWNGQMHRVAVLADGFAWNGKTYPSLSKVAFAITGTRWNGPKFFGCETSHRKGPHYEEEISQARSLRDLYPRLVRPRA
jgi:hypothetical protein